MPDALQQAALESLEVGATPLVHHFLQRLQLAQLFQRHLPTLPGRRPALPSHVILNVLLTNLLIARQPLYAVGEWVAQRVPEHLGLLAEQVQLINDDRIATALDHFHRADRATMLTQLVKYVVREFAIDLKEFHQDTTTVTFSGKYDNQEPTAQADRPPWITFGYNKDHRPDLKQLLYCVTISADGAVPVHAKTYDGNTTDDAVHQDTWSFLQQIVGSPNFLYVADSKLCTRDNMNFIATANGRFLTVMPRTRSEYGWFCEYLQSNPIAWVEVHRQRNSRRRSDPDEVYHGSESPQSSSEGYRVLWYRSSQKQQQDQQDRTRRLQRARAALETAQAPGRRRWHGMAQARQAAQRILDQEQVQGLLRIEVECELECHYEQLSRGRPGPNTQYRQVETPRFRVRFEEDTAALVRQARCDGLFPLMTNDKSLSVAEALRKYKYQPFVEKRHEQLKSVFGVVPMWLKKVKRIECLLWLFYVVELVAALAEREVRRQMRRQHVSSLAVYPEGRPNEAPTWSVMLNVLENRRRHRLLDTEGQELLRRFDPLTDAAQELLRLLGVNRAAYGIEGY
jgi:transposase